MTLTSPLTQYVSIAAAVVVTFAVLGLWNRVRGPRAVRMLERCGLLLGGYAATAAAVLVSVNIAYGGLIVSMDDLFADLNPPTPYQFGHMHHPHRHPSPRGATPTPTPTTTAIPTATPTPTATATASPTPTAISTLLPELAG